MTRIFASTEYEPDEDGVLHAVLPDRCVFAPPGADECSIRVDHRRARKTGPALAVVVCRRHSSMRYTLYPLGQAPYRRLKVAPVGLDGRPLRAAGSNQVPWSWTLAGRAINSKAEEERRTQRRRLDEAARLTGIHPHQTGRQRELIASRLLVPTLSSITRASRWARHPDLRVPMTAQAISAIPIRGDLLERTLAAGALKMRVRSDRLTLEKLTARRGSGIEEGRFSASALAEMAARFGRRAEQNLVRRSSHPALRIPSL